MGFYCIVCRGNQLQGNGIMLHSFPKDQELFDMWIKTMEIKKDRKISKYTKLCSIHFTDDDFQPSLVAGRPRLKKGAIPSIRTLNEFVELEACEDNSDNNTNIEPCTNEVTKPVKLDDYVPKENPLDEIEMLDEDEYYVDEDSFEEFNPDVKIEDAEQSETREVPDGCRIMPLRYVTEEQFRQYPDALKVMYFMQAKSKLYELNKQVFSLKRSNSNLKQKVKNLNTFTKNMKAEIKKRNKEANIE